MGTTTRTKISKQATQAFCAAALAATTGLCTAATPAAPVPPASEKAVAPAANTNPTAACERAVIQALPAGQRAEASFVTAPAIQPAMSDSNQSVLRGTGKTRSGTFTYSCNVDLRSDDAVGVVLRQTGAAATPAEPRAMAEPDLSQLSPQACESRAAAVLKQRWPLVSHINFDAATRNFRQTTADRAELSGQGQALPAPNAPSTFFSFDCVLDPRDGRVVSARVSG